MDLSTFFIALVLLTLILRLWLAYRHAYAVRTHRYAVPSAFAHTITLDAHQKAADYVLAKTRLGAASIVAEAAILLLMTVGGGLQSIDLFWQRMTDPVSLVHGTLVVVSSVLLVSLVHVPFAIYKVFVIDTRFAFNTMTWRLYLTDFIKHSVLSAIIGVPLLCAALLLMRYAGEYWWIELWLIWSGLNLLMLVIYPTLIAPWFNTFSPLQNETLQARIETLLSKCGFQSKGLFVMNGSARSNHGNAYFTGFGSTKRVVFFDTLLERLEVNEIEAVLAHELGHFKHNHLIKRIIFVFTLSFLGLWVLYKLENADWFYSALGLTQSSPHLALALFLLLSPLALTMLQPLLASYSRKNEFEADRYAATYVNPQHLRDALVKLYRDNAATLTPDWLYSAFYDSHPPATIRIAKLSGVTHR